VFLLDTNVVSELMRAAPDPRVVRWLDEQSGTDLWVSAIAAAEIRLGVALLPEGRRRRALVKHAEAIFDEEFAGRCVPFDLIASAEYAEIVATRTRRGRPIATEDAQIAAIALSTGLTLVTRNVGDFQGIERLAVFNPWR